MSPPEPDRPLRSRVGPIASHLVSLSLVDPQRLAGWEAHSQTTLLSLLTA